MTDYNHMLRINGISCSMIYLIFGMLFLFVGCSQKPSSSGVSVIPRPVSLDVKPGEFVFSSEFAIFVDSQNRDIHAVAVYLKETLDRAMGMDIGIRDEHRDKSDHALTMMLTSSDANLGQEGYRLEITPEHILLKAEEPRGLFYGVQSLLQLMPEAVFSDEQVDSSIRWVLPCLTIQDMPRYPYRGMHLDVGRHFFHKDFVKRYIDLLAMHKFNTFHWHLTEDQGWRIEIKKYPKLTEVGAYRKETLIGHYRDRPHKFDGKRYGGYYTQDDIREIVQYARERYITIIPEIEMPGHSQAVLAAYPELSCTGGPFEVATIWGVKEDVYCAGNEKVFTFLQDVLTEVMDLFPGKYIHIGGDECPKTRWEACPKCQARIEAEGLKDEHELQSYFIKRIEKFLLSRGRRLIGWDEILEGGLAPEATVMSWRGMKGGIAAAKAGHDVIMTPTSHCYFDYYQADPETEPLAIGGLTPVEKVYSFEPTPEELTREESRYILGAQGNVWTEYISTPDYAEYMSVPRMCALAEVVWTPGEAREWDDFRGRLKAHMKRFDMMNVHYYRIED